MQDDMFKKFDNGYYRNYTLKRIRSLVPRPPHFGAVKFYEKKSKLLKRKFRYKYWELWFIQTGELLVEFEMNVNTNCKGFGKRERNILMTRYINYGFKDRNNYNMKKQDRNYKN